MTTEEISQQLTLNGVNGIKQLHEARVNKIINRCTTIVILSVMFTVVIMCFLITRK